MVHRTMRRRVPRLASQADVAEEENMPQHEPEPSEREKKRAALLKEALDRPGVREAMKVFRDWQRADHGLDAYRIATKVPYITMTTDHANIR